MANNCYVCGEEATCSSSNGYLCSNKICHYASDWDSEEKSNKEWGLDKYGHEVNDKEIDEDSW